VREVVNHAVETYGRLDVFFANAGIVGPMSVFTEVEEEGFMATLRTNCLR
jgi:NAD(P)-dependent dehydrogenase (short-subunit alcohol dehydrogenase family)